MKPILVQKISDGSLWWVVDSFLRQGLHGRDDLEDFVCEPCINRCFRLIPADENNKHSRTDFDYYYTFLSN